VKHIFYVTILGVEEEKIKGDYSGIPVFISIKEFILACERGETLMSNLKELQLSCPFKLPFVIKMSENNSLYDSHKTFECVSLQTYTKSPEELQSEVDVKESLKEAEESLKDSRKKLEEFITLKNKRILKHKRKLESLVAEKKVKKIEGKLYSKKPSYNSEAE